MCNLTSNPWWMRFWIAWSLLFMAHSLGWIARGIHTTFHSAIVSGHVVLLVFNCILLYRTKSKEVGDGA